MSDENQRNTPHRVDEPSDDFVSRSYPAPVNTLLTLGRHQHITDIDYHGLGIRQRDIPALLRMVADDSLHNAAWDEAGNEPAGAWAPIHAWRALAQMHAVESAQHLIDHLFWRVDNGDEWVMLEMPTVFQLFGVKAIPPLMEFLNPENRAGIQSRFLAIDCLLAIANNYPRADVVVGELLYQQLQRHADQYPEVNAHLAVAVIGLKPDAQALIEEAVNAGHVDVDLMSAEMSDIFDIAQNLMGEDFFAPSEADVDGVTDIDPRLQAIRMLLPRKDGDTNKKKHRRNK